MKTAKTYGNQDKFNEALGLLNNGSKWNGKVYTTKRGKQNMVLSVYLDGTYLSLGEFWNEDVQKAKKEFIVASEQLTGNEIPKKKDSYDFGTTNWWASGMNGE